MLNKLVEILFKTIINMCFILAFVTCGSDLKILFNENLDNISIPLQLSWTTNQDNVDPLVGGWRINNEGRQIRFEIEDSWNCVAGGSNAVQSGTATATITTVEPYQFIPVIEGIGELQDNSFERMEVTLNGIHIVSSRSTGGNLGCQMGPVLITEHVSPPYILPAGIHTFEIDFTTFDNNYHVGAYYELNLLFIE